MGKWVTAFLLVALVGPAQAGPQTVLVTAEKPQAHITVQTAHLGNGFYGFTVRTKTVPQDDIRAYLVLRNEKGNLLSTPMLRSQMDGGIVRVYAAVHADLLQWAQIQLKQGPVLYRLQLESFKYAFEK